MITENIEKNWTLCILEYGESSPLKNHGAFELGADDENKRIYGSETLIRTMGLNPIVSACRGYVNRGES